jgi:hypothetical protein
MRHTMLFAAALLLACTASAQALANVTPVVASFRGGLYSLDFTL